MSFYKMQRGWQESEVFNNELYSERDAWSWMVGATEWRRNPKPISINSKPVKLKRGQITHSLRFLAQKFGWSTGKVDRFIKKLILWEMLKIVTTIETGQNILSVCNYSKYQRSYKPDETPDETDVKTDPKHMRDKEEESTKKVLKKRIVGKPDSVSQSVWGDFLKLREGKRAPVTDTVLSIIQKEADKAGWKLEDVLAKMCARGWQGVEADWLKDTLKKGNGHEQQSDRNLEGLREWVDGR